MVRDPRPIIKFDTETCCKLDLSVVGRHRYLAHPTADVLMFSWKIGSAPTELWRPGMEVPIFFRNTKDFRYAAFNAIFDWRVINQFSKRYGFGRLELEQMIDIMGVAARYGLPQSLDRLGKALKVRMTKMSAGKALKKVCCCVPPVATPQQWKQFEEYCVRDTDSMSEIMRKMPSDQLSESEQKIWVDTARINNRGVPVNTWGVKQINKVVDYYTDKQMRRLPFLTNGMVKTVGQTAKIREFCAANGVDLPNLQALTVDAEVERLRTLIPLVEENKNGLYSHVVGTDYQKVYEVLRIRQLIGGAAVKKFKRLEAMSHQKIIHDNLRYHGAGTGRCTGGGFQMLNLPRAKVKPAKGQTYDEAVAETLQTFFDASVLKHPDPLLQAKKLVRPSLKTRDTHRLVVADWGSIEYILEMYFAGEWEKVERFRNGFDPYIDFATELFHVAYDDVSDRQRQESKPPVLGSGYMLGWGGLIGYADGYGVAMTEKQAKIATHTYRESHPLVVESWYSLKNAAHGAVKYPGKTFKAFTQDGSHDLKTSFIVRKDRTGRPWLIMTLPSGRNLFYCQPQLVRGKYGSVIQHMGVNPDTKQWGRVFLKPQRIIENVIQALGRDILNNGLEAVQKHGFRPIFHVYDEIGCIEPVVGAEQRLKEMTALMCLPPEWMPNLPLRADGYVSQCYMKG